jgi:hypothetical protein
MRARYFSFLFILNTSICGLYLNHYKNSDALFARKFDEKIDNEIIEKLYFDIKA